MTRPNVNEHATSESRRRGALAAAASKRERREEARRLLDEARRDKLDEAVDRLAGAASLAAEKMIEAMLEARSESVRLRAAFAVIEMLAAFEMREWFERIERLEQAAERNGAA